MFAACVLQCVGKHREKSLQLWLELKEGGSTQRVQGNVHTNWRCVCSRTCMCMECLYFCVIQVQFVQTNPH